MLIFHENATPNGIPLFIRKQSQTCLKVCLFLDSVLLILGSPFGSSFQHKSASDHPGGRSSRPSKTRATARTAFNRFRIDFRTVFSMVLGFIFTSFGRQFGARFSKVDCYSLAFGGYTLESYSLGAYTLGAST